MVERVFVRHEIRKRRGTSGQGSGRRRRCRQRTENRAGNEGVNDKEIHREETRLSLIIWINRAYFTRVGLFRRAISAQKQDRLKFHRGRSLVYRHLTTFALSSGNNEKNPFKSHTKLSGISTYSSLAPLLFSPNVISRTSYKEYWFIKTPWNLRRMLRILRRRKDIISSLLSDILNEITSILERYD